MPGKPDPAASVTPATMSGAAILVQCLIEQGVEFVFGYPGGAVLPIYDALFGDERIRHILVRHEAGAAHAAEGYARATGKPGVVLVTSGPGATNAVTGIADAFMDSIPLVVITGQVPTALIGTDAFQEADTVGITRHCTKHNYLVKDPADLAATIKEAFLIATTGRPGPVVIDIPKNVQIAIPSERRALTRSGAHRYAPQTVAPAEHIIEAVEMIANAERPIFYTGGGVINSGPGASQLLRELAKITGVPAGNYTVTETQPAGYLDGKDTIGTTGGTAGNDLLSGITLVAHSVSCNIGLLASIARPDLFERLVLLGPNPCFLNHPPDYHGGFNRTDLEGLLSLMEMNYIGWANYLAPLAAGAAVGDAVTGTFIDSFCSTDPIMAHAFAQATFFSDIRPALQLCLSPCLILHHQRDALVPTPVADYLHAALTGSTLQTLDVSGHCAQMSHPELVSAAMHRYLQGARTRALS